jgi:signal transduction histidine kinase/response regulator RpfG family c-di-GMP phosphodiesterase
MPATLPDVDPVNVLLVDDRAGNLVALESILCAADYQLVSAKSGVEALAQLRTREFAVILTDVMMPEMDGFELVRRIKQSESLREIPIIFLTAMAADQGDVFRGYAVGAVDYLQKPLDPEVVRAKVAVFAQIYRQKQLIRRQAAQLLDSERREQAHRLAEVERRAAEAAERRMQFLDQAGHTLTASLDFQTTLRSLANLSVPAIADWCCVDLWEGAGTIRRVAIAQPDTATSRIGAELSRRFPPRPDAPIGSPQVIRSGQSALAAEVTDAMLRAAATDADHLALLQQLGACSFMIVPLIARDRTLGAITFISAESQRRYAREDLLLAEDLASRAALAVDNARLYQESQVLNRVKDEFLATLQHELRTPLNAIVGWLTVLELEPPDAETLREGIEVMRRSAAAQTALINDVLDVSRIITGKLELAPVRLDLAREVASAVAQFQLSIRTKGLDLRIRIADPEVVVFGDALRMQQIIWNLLSNAIKFTAPGGHVVVALRAADGLAELSVTDDGQGIDPEFLPHVFERFRQEDGSLTRVHGGLGLGLAIVRHLTELHGGTATVSSAGRGRGATFTISIPLLRVEVADLQAEARVSGATEQPDEGAMRRRQSLAGVDVLVVDDEEDARAVLRRLLRGYGARVSEASSAAEALVKLSSEEPDVLLCDIGMPGEDGLSLIGKIRAREPAEGARLPAAALTAYATPADLRRVLEAGFDRHLAKPVNPEDLIAAVTRLVGDDRAQWPRA